MGETVDSIKSKIVDIVKKNSNVNLELGSFVKADLTTKLKQLKFCYWCEFGSRFDKMMRIVELSKFLSLFVNGVDLLTMKMVAEVSEIDATTFLTKITPELKEPLIYLFLKENGYGKEICESYSGSMTRYKLVLTLSQLMHDITCSSLLKKDDSPELIDKFIKLVIENNINIVLNVLVDKSVLLFKKKKGIKKIKNCIIDSFKKRIAVLFGINEILINNKKINILSIYSKTSNKNLQREFELITNFYKKIAPLIGIKKFILLKIKNKDDVFDKNFRKEYKDMLKEIKKNKCDYVKIATLLANFAEKILDNLEKSKGITNNDRLLLSKIKKTYTKYA
ncbi:MAG: hypothetical protein LBH46_02305 [Rickettsiales bacterium]|jgi:glycyl-tRNA synthetase beta subunit|nr:hypothetical protein [Rickettsiales bacterium]